jgi:uncharacterized RDD family membrane protein YckC
MNLSTLNYQGIGPRFVAQIVDSIVLIVLYFVVGTVLFGGPSFDVYGAAAVSFGAIYATLSFLYFTVLEAYKGATVGKMLAKIKVVREDGSPIGIGPAIIRNILRIVDALPFLYIIDMIFISRSSKKQRLGDSIAKTIVVKAGGEKLTPSYTPTSVPASLQQKSYCINCGAEMNSGVNFCPKCGTKQQ